MKKIISVFLSLLTVFSFSTLSVSADEKPENETYKDTFTISYANYDSFSPEDEIEVDGEKYLFKNFHIVKDDKKTFDITVDNLTKKEYNAPKNAVNPNNNTQSGKLINTVFSENKETGRTETVTKTISYSKVRLDYTIPQTYKIEYTDEKTSTAIDVQLELENTVKSDAYWIDTGGLKGVVTGYDALYYNLNNSDTQIPKNEKQPVYKGYESAILKSLELSDDYKITGSSWDGEAYYNAEGVLCRNCIYDAQLKVCDITASYSATVDLPDIITYTATSTYEDEKSSLYTIEAEYEKAETEKSISTPVIVAGIVIGLLILAALIAGTLVYLSKKKKAEATQNG